MARRRRRKETIHNPFDQAFKDLADYDLRGMMHLTGRLHIDAVAKVSKLPSEIRGPAKLADHVGIVETAGGSYVEETEAVWDWGPEEEVAIVERLGTLWQVPSVKAHRNIKLTIVLLNEDGAPDDRKERLMVSLGSFFAGVHPVWVKFYEVPAALALEVGSAEALAMVPLMRHTLEDLEEARCRLKAIGKESALAQFLFMVDRRYGKNGKGRQLGMFERVTMEAARSTEFARVMFEAERREALETGRKRGLEEGKELGKELGRELAREQYRQGLIRMVRRVLASRFPDLADHPGLESVPFDRVEDLCDRVVAADNSSIALAAILDLSRVG
jgi:hypothetical protein